MALSTMHANSIAAAIFGVATASEWHLVLLLILWEPLMIMALQGAEKAISTNILNIS